MAQRPLWLGALLMTACVGLLSGLPTPPVAVHVTPSNPHVLMGVQNVLTVLLEVNCSAVAADETTKPHRTSFELAIVLDRSGSMAGEKLEYAKRAIHNLIDNLLPTDIVHVVVFDDHVDTAIATGRPGPEGTPKLHEAVRAIEDGGSTNIYGGLKRGFDLLTELRSTHTDGVKRVSRLFLFSDGMANAGETSPTVIAGLVQSMRSSQDIVTSAFGLGTDFDEELVRAIAREGGGEYFFVGNAEDTDRVVSIGLKGVANLVGADPRLTVTGTNGAVVQEVLGHRGQPLQEGVPLRPLRAGMGQRVLVKLAITPPVDAKPGEHIAVLQWQLAYKPVGADAPQTLAGELSLWFATDASLVKQEDQRVREFRELLEVGLREDHVRSLLEAGELTEAITVQNEIVQLYTSNSLGKARLARAVRTQSVIEQHGVGLHAQMESRFVADNAAILSDFEDEM